MSNINNSKDIEANKVDEIRRDDAFEVVDANVNFNHTEKQVATVAGNMDGKSKDECNSKKGT